MQVGVELLLDNDLVGAALERDLQCKLRSFQSRCDVVRPCDGVQLFTRPANGWQPVPKETNALYIQQVGDGEVPQAGY